MHFTVAHARAENFQILAQLIQEHGDIMCLWLGTEMNIFLSNTKDVEVRLKHAIN